MAISSAQNFFQKIKICRKSILCILLRINDLNEKQKSVRIILATDRWKFGWKCLKNEKDWKMLLCGHEMVIHGNEFIRSWPYYSTLTILVVTLMNSNWMLIDSSLESFNLIMYYKSLELMILVFYYFFYFFNFF